MALAVTWHWGRHRCLDRPTAVAVTLLLLQRHSGVDTAETVAALAATPGWTAEGCAAEFREIAAEITLQGEITTQTGLVLP